jgi:hypothetical protein
MKNLEKPTIHMDCPTCKSGQTFAMINDYSEGSTNLIVPGKVQRLVYQCVSCSKFSRYFLVKFDTEGNYVMKVGQEPPWDITPDPILAAMLGPQANKYKKGLVSESQGYGIGAFAYYRRIVEDVIDELLGAIPDLMSGDDRARFDKALDDVRKTTITQEKIDLVKELLPPILRPNGMNPLAILHNTLSKGLHNESDEECLKLAMETREILAFMVNQVNTTRTSAKSFTESMRRLLERKTKST